MQNHAEGDRHPGEDDRHLPLLRVADSGGSAGGRVNDDEKTGEQDRQAQIPAEESGKNDRRGVNRNAGRETALEKKEKCAQQSRLLIEALPEILIGRHHLEPVIDRDEDGADHDEREGQAEIILDEAHPAFVSLPGCGEKSDRAGLRRHDGESDRPPANARVAVQIMPEIVIGTRLPPAVNRNREQRAEEHGVVDPTHEKCRLTK